MQYKPFSLIYNCSNCSDKQKKVRGCKRKPFENLRIDCTCGGSDGCEICRAPVSKGSKKKTSLGYFYIDRCPVSFSNDNDINRMLPYFWHWRATNSMMYPDNRGRYYQPSKLLEAFSICGFMCNKREQIEIDNANNLRK
jgi:hypothetical protein